MSAPRDTDLSALREALAATLDNLRGPLEDTTKARAANWLNDQGDALLAALALPRETAAAPALDVELLRTALTKAGEYVSGPAHGHPARIMHRHVPVTAEDVAAIYERLRAARLSASGNADQ